MYEVKAEVHGTTGGRLLMKIHNRSYLWTMFKCKDAWPLQGLVIRQLDLIRSRIEPHPTPVMCSKIIVAMVETRFLTKNQEKQPER